MVRVEQLRDLETAKQVASLLEAENARLHQRLEALVAENARLKGEDAQARLQLELEQLKEQLALMQKRLFGASSEKRGEKTAKPPRAKPQRGHGPTAQPELTVQEVLLPLDAADPVCGLCGGGLHAWEGQTENCEEITVVERSFVLRRVKRQKYRCGQGCAPVTAPAPPRLIPGGRYSVDFAVYVALMKYGFHLPLARQERLYGREDLVVEAQTLWDPLDALAGHLQKSYEALLAEVHLAPHPRGRDALAALGQGPRHQVVRVDGGLTRYSLPPHPPQPLGSDSPDGAGRLRGSRPRGRVRGIPDGNEVRRGRARPRDAGLLLGARAPQILRGQAVRTRLRAGAGTHWRGVCH